MRLQDFAEGRCNDARDMRMVMRPLLERYIRYRFPNQILEGKWLGDMLAIIRADTGHPLTPQYAELDDINGYTRSEEHTSELQSLMRNSYAVFCLKKTKK